MAPAPAGRRRRAYLHLSHCITFRGLLHCSSFGVRDAPIRWHRARRLLCLSRSEPLTVQKPRQEAALLASQLVMAPTEESGEPHFVCPCRLGFEGGACRRAGASQDHRRFPRCALSSSAPTAQDTSRIRPVSSECRPGSKGGRGGQAPSRTCRTEAQRGPAALRKLGGRPSRWEVPGLEQLMNRVVSCSDSGAIPTEFRRDIIARPLPTVNVRRGQNPLSYKADKFAPVRQSPRREA